MSNFILNYKKDPVDSRDIHFKVVAPIKLPKQLDLSPKMPDILNQGNLGSCTSNALANCLEFLLMKEKKNIFNPSRLFIYYNGRIISNLPLNEDTGMSLRSGCKAIAKYLVCNETIWPYLIEKFAEKPDENAYTSALKHKKIKYEALNQSLRSFKTCLASGFPFAFGISIYSSFMSDNVSENGIVPMPLENDTYEGGHAIICCGYDDEKKLFKCQNSWGKDWGDNGFFYLPYDYLSSSKLSSDFWKISYFV